MRFFSDKKIILTFVLVFAVLLIGGIRFAHAAGSSIIGDIAAGAVITIAKVMGYIIGFIGGVFLSIAGYLITFALKINFELLSSPMVHTGWQIVLNFANLGFVLAIIVIAFSTIFRRESYAMKQTLWKLIVAALLVNFSLVIAGAFISVSDVFSDFFLKQSGIRSANEWGLAFSNMLKAQALFKIDQAQEINLSDSASVDQAMATVNAISGSALIVVSSVFFIALFTVLGGITMLAAAIMLLIRYVYLGILLLLSPIIWLLWIFPGTSGIWQMWWKKFIRWTFFAPIMLFFMSLAMYAMKNQPEIVNQMLQNRELTGSVRLTFGAGVIGEMVMAVGLVVGGLIAANSFGITFSKTALGWAQKVSKGFGSRVGGWTARKGRVFGTAPFRSQWARRQIEGMQKLGTRKGILGFVGRNVTAPLGTAISGIGVVQGEQLFKNAQNKQKDISSKQLALRIAAMSRDEQVSALARLQKEGNLDLVPNVSRYINYNTKKLFSRYGQDKAYTDIKKSLGFDEAMLTGKDEKGNSISRQAATEAFRRPHKIEDYNILKGDIFRANAAYGLSQADHDEIRRLTRETIFGMHPGAISKIRPKLSDQDFLDFQEELDNYIDNFERTINLEVTRRGLTVPIKTKMEWIEDPANNVSRNDQNLIRGLYNSRKNFGGSLFGAGFFGGGAGPTQSPTP